MITTALKQAIEQSELSKRQIALKSDVDPAQLSRFLSGRSSLSLDAVDRLCETLRLKITIPRQRQQTERQTP